MIKLHPTLEQRKLIQEIFDVSRFIYNKTNYLVKQNISLHKKFQNLRNILVTERSKLYTDAYKQASIPVDLKKQQIINGLNESEKLFYTIEREILMQERRKLVKTENYAVNMNIKKFELNVSKEIRANAVKNLCEAYKTAIANLKAGNIKFFDISYKKKNSPNQCAELSSTDISLTKNGLKICPNKFKEHSYFKLGKRNAKKYKNFIINNNCDLVKRNDGYYLALIIKTEIKENKIFENMCGVDPGIRTFLTCYSSKGIVEYQHNSDYLKKLRNLLKELKDKKTKKVKKQKRKGLRKRTLTKIDIKEKNFIDDLHWKSINSLLKNNDVIFFGDIKSHNIVKDGKNRTLNRQMNQLKFYVFKQRLLYKALLHNKKVLMINEAYTSQCCSSCGNLWKELKSSKIYRCQNKQCNLICDRDINASKNILMKGIL
jgi:putative transposase